MESFVAISTLAVATTIGAAVLIAVLAITSRLLDARRTFVIGLAFMAAMAI